MTFFFQHSLPEGPNVTSCSVFHDQSDEHNKKLPCLFRLASSHLVKLSTSNPWASWWSICCSCFLQKKNQLQWTGAGRRLKPPTKASLHSLTQQTSNRIQMQYTTMNPLGGRCKQANWQVNDYLLDCVYLSVQNGACLCTSHKFNLPWIYSRSLILTTCTPSQECTKSLLAVPPPGQKSAAGSWSLTAILYRSLVLFQFKHDLFTAPLGVIHTWGNPERTPGPERT